MHIDQDIITLAIVNFKVAAGDKERNLSRIKEYSVAAARRGADLILFPELCLMGYDFFTDQNISMEEKIAAAEFADGRVCLELSQIAVERNLYIVFGMAEKIDESGDLYNSAVVLSPDGAIDSYQKIHPYANENSWCKKGSKPFTFQTKWGPVGLGICFDSYQFPELMRYYVHKGARLYLNPTAVLEERPNQGSHEAFKRSYTPHLEYGVLANSIYIASSNLTGYDKTSYFGGGSMIIGPKTNAFEEVDVICYCGDDSDQQVGMHISTLDLSLAVRHLCVDNPYVGEPDYRPEIYKNLWEDCCHGK